MLFSAYLSHGPDESIHVRISNTMPRHLLYAPECFFSDGLGKVRRTILDLGTKPLHCRLYTGIIIQRVIVKRYVLILLVQYYQLGHSW